MPRRNLYLLVFVSLIAVACYQRAASAQRNRYGRMFETFVTMMDEIDTHYVEKVDERKLFEGALTGMTRQLDEHSTFFNPHEYQQLSESLQQHFGGVGIQVGVDETTKLLTVITPMYGTPAYHAGIRAGDKIIEIDGKSTEGFVIDDALIHLRGEPGQRVRLTVLHEGETEPVTIDIERAIIKVESVLGDRHAPDGTWDYFLEGQDRLGYLRLTSFSNETVEELRMAIDWLKERDMRGLVLDMRNNPGGLLDSAVAVSDLFVREGDIVTTRGRDGVEREVFRAKAKGTYEGFPIVILVNRYSASASEIVAACLQDHGKAKVVGERTFGKGSVQNIIPLEENRSALKLTMATYWRPSGRNIHRLSTAKEEDEWGVRPDAGEVKLEGEAFRQMLLSRRDRDIIKPAGAIPLPADRHDPQLDKAIEVLLNLVK